jgi:hypothetical protein
MRRQLNLLILFACAACGGCRSAEVTVNYPIAGVYVAAKFEAKDPAVKPIVVAKVTTEVAPAADSKDDAPTASGPTVTR